VQRNGRGHTGLQTGERPCQASGSATSLKDVGSLLYVLLEEALDDLIGPGRSSKALFWALYPIGAHNEALLEGIQRSACLQRDHVPPLYLPHYPRICGICQKDLTYLILVYVP
jgi:hypothetical protein